jgi:hypothetical protein
MLDFADRLVAKTIGTPFKMAGRAISGVAEAFIGNLRMPGKSGPSRWLGRATGEVIKTTAGETAAIAPEAVKTAWEAGRAGLSFANKTLLKDVPRSKNILGKELNMAAGIGAVTGMGFLAANEGYGSIAHAYATMPGNNSGAIGSMVSSEYEIRRTDGVTGPSPMQLPSLTYDGIQNMPDNLGATGEMAIALHNNRHRRR